MAHSMIQFQYGQEDIKALIQEPGNRAATVRQGVESFGGRLHSFFHAYGEYDGVAVAEFPDSESCTAFRMMVTSKGGAAAFRTTVLIDRCGRTGRTHGTTPPDYEI